jgi:hypothetical protein
VSTLCLQLTALLGLLLGAATGCAHFGPPRVEPTGGRAQIAIRYQPDAATLAAPPAGYHVWGASNPDGPFERLTAAPVSLPASVAPGDVVLLHRDRGLPPGAVRYYYLEAVAADGTSRKITAVSRAEARLPDRP